MKIYGTYYATVVLTRFQVGAYDIGVKLERRGALQSHLEVISVLLVRLLHRMLSHSVTQNDYIHRITSLVLSPTAYISIWSDVQRPC